MSLTPLQASTLEFIDGFIQSKGYSPSYTEIMEWCGIKSKSGSHRLVHSLVSRGYLKKVGHHRGLEVLRRPQDDSSLTNCHSTLLLEEVFSQSAVRDAMSDGLLARVKDHVRRVKLMGAF